MDDVAVCFSGGGLTSIISTVCTMEALYQHEHIVKAEEFSGVSGGLLGYVLYENAELEFPGYLYDSLRSRKSISTADLYQAEGLDESKVWYAEGKDAYPDIEANFVEIFSNGSPEVWINITRDGWAPYNVDVDALVVGTPLVGGAAFLKQVTGPFAATDFDAQGFLTDAADYLYPAWFNLAVGEETGLWQVLADDTYSTDDNSVVNAVAYGTSFWQSDVLTNDLAYFVAADALLSVDLSSANGESMAGYMLDGGVIDSTGIVNALRGSKSNIISHNFNNAGELQDFDVSFSVLFGVAPQNPTNKYNNLPGPELLQVFPSDRYDEFLSQVDSGLIHLQDLTTVENSYLGVVGGRTIDNLIVSTLGNSDAFFESLTKNSASEIELMRNLTGPEWPAGGFASVTHAQANLFCDFAAFKAMGLQSLIHSLLQ